MHLYWDAFAQLIRTPFTESSLIWGIVPLYFALLLNELTSAKANFRTAIQTGFSFLWAAAQWFYLSARTRSTGGAPGPGTSGRSINLLVTCVVLVIGLLALYSGF